MNVYDHYEISPCTRTEEPDSPGKFYFEVCEPEEADVWTLYGHISGEGVEAIGDFPTREAAVQVYSRITGLPFAASYEADARLRVMYAGTRMLEALELCIPVIEDNCLAAHFDPAFSPEAEALELAQAAIAQATGRACLESPKPIVIEVRGGVVQDVLHVPPGYEYEVKDYDNIEADEDAERRPS